MIIEIPDDNSIVKWKKNDKDEWKSAEISDLINVYEKRTQGECEKCDYRKFTKTVIDVIIDVMTDNGITSVEQLSEMLNSYLKY